MDDDGPLAQPARLLLLVSMLAKNGTICANGKALLKELIVHGDPRSGLLLDVFEQDSAAGASDAAFLGTIHELIDAQAHRLYAALFTDCDLQRGKALSKKERAATGRGDVQSLVYGEVDFQSFVHVLRKAVGPTAGKRFYDLGSGTGKAVFAARLTQDFEECIGVELLEGLYRASEAVSDRFASQVRQYLSTEHSQRTRMVHGSLLDVDWSDGDVVFANSTCFDDQLMDSISRQAEALRPGSIMITFTKSLSSECFAILEQKRYTMSWGQATVFIQRRNARPAAAPTGTATPAPAAPSKATQAAKLTPPRPKRNIADLSRSADEAAFPPLTSPQDSELMRRKRKAHSKAGPAPPPGPAFPF